MNDKIILVTGGFDPLHSGHIEYINHAAEYGRVVVGVNSDDWLTKKKGRPFMSIEERLAIMGNLKNVMCAIRFDDSDGSAKDAIKQVREMFPKNIIVFANGGDRTKTNIPELEAYKDDPMVEFVFEVGGNDKKNSSSWILEEWKNPSESRVWGRFFTYYDSKNCKIKRLTLDPGKSISMQYHNNRSEFWFVENGNANIFTLENDQEVLSKEVKQHDTYTVGKTEWHRLQNVGLTPLNIVEIQYGDACHEEDIVRKLLDNK